MSNTDNSYNGWTNYATWLVALGMFDGMEPGYFGSIDSIYELSLEMKRYAEELMEEQAKGLALDYAEAFLSGVDWYDIAENHAEDLVCEADEDEQDEDS